MSSPIRSYRDLAVWQKSVDLAVHLYDVTRRYPKAEIYGLTSQTRRSGVSIPANIAEGQGKSGAGQYLNHLSHARGSLRELDTLLIISNRIGYVPDIVFLGLEERTDEIGRMLHGLSLSVERSHARGAPASRGLP